MCNAYHLRHRNEALLDIARAMQLPLDDLPDFAPLHRIGIRQRGLILRPQQNGKLAWSWARWSLVPPGSRELPPYPLNNARADKRCPTEGDSPPDPAYQYGCQRGRPRDTDKLG